MSIRMGRKKEKMNGVLFISDDRRTKVYVWQPDQQPRPTFFSNAQIERMNKQPGSYQFKGR